MSRRPHYQQPPQVVALGRRGFSLLVDEIPVFLAFRDYPAFAGASADALRQVQRPSVDRLHWPELGITLRTRDLPASTVQEPSSPMPDGALPEMD